MNFSDKVRRVSHNQSVRTQRLKTKEQQLSLRNKGLHGQIDFEQKRLDERLAEKAVSQKYAGHEVDAHYEKAHAKRQKRLSKLDDKKQRTGKRLTLQGEKQKALRKKIERMEHSSLRMAGRRISRTGKEAAAALSAEAKRVEQPVDTFSQAYEESIKTVGRKVKNTVKSRVGMSGQQRKLLKLHKRERRLAKKQVRFSKRQVRLNRKRLYALQRKNGMSPWMIWRNNFLAAASEWAPVVWFKHLFVLLRSPLVLLGSSGVVLAAVVFLLFFLPTSLFFPSSSAQNNAGGTETLISAYGTKGINLNSPSYQGDSPYTASGLRGQCTWFVWGRVNELYGKRLPANMGDAGQWAYSARNIPLLAVGNVPRKHSIMVLSGGNWGHVAFVEDVDLLKQEITVSEGNIGNPLSGSEAMVGEAHRNYASYFRLSEKTKSDFKSWRGMSVIGFIYLDDYVTIGQ